MRKHLKLDPMTFGFLFFVACGTSSQPPSCDGGGCEDAGQPDAGADAGPDAGVPLDLRFRGVSALLHTGGFNDGGGALGGAFKITNDSGGFSVADTTAQSFFRFFEFPPAPGVAYRSEIIADGATCPDSFASLLAQNMVVLGLGGDPSISLPPDAPLFPGADCTMLGVAVVDAGPTFSYLTATGSTTDKLSAALAQDAQSRSFVVTALSAPDSGIAYVAESRGALPDGGLESFDTQIVTASEETLDAQSQLLAGNGYIITASTWSGTKFILVGTRPTDSVIAHTTIAERVPAELGAGVVQRLADGYAAVSYMDDIVGEADGGTDGGFYIIWEK
jgi:hypothetical protein